MLSWSKAAFIVGVATCLGLIMDDELCRAMVIAACAGYLTEGFAFNWR